jgi:hypothetical protein
VKYDSFNDVITDILKRKTKNDDSKKTKSLYLTVDWTPKLQAIVTSPHQTPKEMAEADEK